jgi:hypothetical protein
MEGYHLAQLNVADMRYPLESDEMAGFVEALEPLNALADAAPGFVWRLESDDGDATSFRVFDSDMVLINLSVWESVDALREFAYKGDHLTIMRRRTEWFHRMAEAYLVLWWVPAGTMPTIDEAKDRLDLLRRLGPTADAFTFRTQFPAPVKTR